MMKTRIVRRVSELVVIVLLSGVAAQAAVRYVALDGSGTDGRSWATAYKTIDAAIQASSTVAGDEIRVKQGTYSIAFPIVVNKAVKLYGGYAGNLEDSRDWRTFTTTIDGAERVMHCFDVTTNAQFDGLTIARGAASGSNPNNQGGGMYIHGCYPAVSHCTFYRNYADYMGGAVSISNAPGTTIGDCIFTENTSGQLGGAILCRSNVTISDCQFQANETGSGDADGYGGAIRNESCSPTITGCTFTGNTADYGGAICNRQADADIESCTFADCGRTTAAGGGLYNLGGAPTISKCLFQGNSVTHRGAAIWDASLTTYVNCILWDNAAATYGGGAYIDESTGEHVSGARFINCTFYANNAFQGGALYSYNASPILTNCILWDDTCWDVDPEIHSVTWVPGRAPVVSYCDIGGDPVYPGAGNICAEPLFLNANGGNFQVQIYSPCVDRGTNDVTDMPPDDYAGGRRISDGDCDNVPTADIGAYELQAYMLIDHVQQATILQGMLYESPSDTTAEYMFLMEFETDDTMASIQFQTPAGNTYVIPDDEHTASANVETHHIKSGDSCIWQYWARFDTPDGLKAYGDGTYIITYFRRPVWIPENLERDSGRETRVAYSLPGGGAIPQPRQKPNVTWPMYGASIISPVTLGWDTCTDPSANSIFLTLIDSATDASIAEDDYPSSATVSDAYTLPEGTYEVELSFASLYDAVDSTGIPFEVGKAVIVGDEFSVLRTAVYRFYSPTDGVHFYTISPAERDNLIAYYPQFWMYEGRAYGACATASDDGLAPVYRFWSGRSHFYTISESERDYLIANFPSVWTYEGIAFYAYPEGRQPADARPVYRFWNPYISSHFYTISETERDMLINEWACFWTYEGIAFYAYQ
jgi:predicted outer membrane repeat protein